MRPCIAAMLAGLLLSPVNAAAGHGLMNAFAGIAWLPEPGTTPDSLAYRFDTWHEQAELLLTDSSADRLTLCLRFAREKLAETEAMVKAQNRTAADTAIAAYGSYLERADAALAAIVDKHRGALMSLFANALLEHQYIIATDYIDLPRESRSVIATMIATASTHYLKLGSMLPRRLKDALFFKEEEVRWSWEMALAADAQGR